MLLIQKCDRRVFLIKHYNSFHTYIKLLKLYVLFAGKFKCKFDSFRKLNLQRKLQSKNRINKLTFTNQNNNKNNLFQLFRSIIRNKTIVTAMHNN